MYKKVLNEHGVVRTDVVFRDTDGASIPVDLQNTDYQLVQAYLTANNLTINDLLTM